MLQRTAPALKRLRSFSSGRKSKNNRSGNVVAELLKKTFSPKRGKTDCNKGEATAGEDRIDFEEFKKMAMDGNWAWIFKPFARKV